MIINPLQLNSTLNAQLREVSAITTFRGFQVWRRDFLEKLEPFVDVDGIETAAFAYQSFGNRMAHLMGLIGELEATLEMQKSQVRYSHEHCLATVRARRCLSEISKELYFNAGLLKSLLPTSQQEQASGYTKLHMGVVFLRDDFAQYSCLVNCEERLTGFHAMWGHVVLDGQTRKAIEMFKNQFQTFCDIMTDLGLSVVMNKCHKLLQVGEKRDVNKIRKGSSKKQAFDGDNSSSSLTTSDLEKSPRYIKKKKQALATSGTESSSTADTISVLEWSSDSLDGMNRPSNSHSLNNSDSDEVVNVVPSDRQKCQKQYPTYGDTTTSKSAKQVRSDIAQEQNGSAAVEKEWLRKVFRWYARMGHPDRETMKKKISTVQSEISSEDIDKLPWMNNGKRIDIVKMNAMCLK